MSKVVSLWHYSQKHKSDISVASHTPPYISRYSKVFTVVWVILMFFFVSDRNLTNDGNSFHRFGCIFALRMRKSTGSRHICPSPTFHPRLTPTGLHACGRAAVMEHRADVTTEVSQNADD